MKIPPKFIKHLHELKDSVRLSMLYRALVLREPGYNCLFYTCHECGRTFSTDKIEIAGCLECGSEQLTSIVKRIAPKPYTAEARELIENSRGYLTRLKCIYTGKSMPVNTREYGFCKAGYYFGFTESERFEEESLRDAVLKASVSLPFLWDFDFDWTPLNGKNLKIYNILSILY